MGASMGANAPVNLKQVHLHPFLEANIRVYLEESDI